MLKRLAALALLAASIGAAAEPFVEVVSALDARWVTGESVLLRIAAPNDVTQATLDGGDVSATFVPDARGLVLLEGLTPGKHVLRVMRRAGTPVTVPLWSHPETGPVISGAHETPFFCETRAFVAGPGTEPVDLGEPDAFCHVPTRTAHYRYDGVAYVPVANGMDAGLVRVETGTLNRSVYQLALPAAWNGRLVYKFGGGCRTGWYRQGASTAGVFEHQMLRRGYAVASASLNVFGNNCNDLLAAETAMMVKERFVEHYGPPLFTIGWGCSGGSYQAHQIADNYRGLLDGIVVGCSFPEVGLATAAKLFDTRLLKHYLDEAGLAWSAPQRLAVTGFGMLATIGKLDEGAARLDATPRDDRASAEFDPVVDTAARWHPGGAPVGARATLMDHTANVLGRDASGRALWPLDNRGIQYGLEAFRRGAIDFERFIDLNRRIGGLDRDGNFVPERTRHDAEATRRAYASGRILSGAGGLAATPIIDYRAYADLHPEGDIHMKYHSFSTRERLIAANGHARNHVMWVEDGLCEGCSLWSLDSPVLQEALEQMDAWLEALVADERALPRARKVVDARPAGLSDACWIDGERIDEIQRPFEGACSARFPTFRPPRMVAGGPMAGDVVACTLRPVTAADYPPLRPDQLEALAVVFRDGVCDWSQRGVARTALFERLSFGPARDSRLGSLWH